MGSIGTLQSIEYSSSLIYFLYIIDVLSIRIHCIQCIFTAFDQYIFTAFGQYIVIGCMLSSYHFDFESMTHTNQIIRMAFIPATKSTHFIVTSRTLRKDKANKIFKSYYHFVFSIQIWNENVYRICYERRTIGLLHPHNSICRLLVFSRSPLA